MSPNLRAKKINYVQIRHKFTEAILTILSIKKRLSIVYSKGRSILHPCPAVPDCLWLLACVMLPLTILSLLPETASLPGSPPLLTPPLFLSSFYGSSRFPHGCHFLWETFLDPRKLEKVPRSCHAWYLPLRIVAGSVLIYSFYHLRARDCVLVITVPTASSRQPINICWRTRRLINEQLENGYFSRLP